MLKIESNIILLLDGRPAPASSCREDRYCFLLRLKHMLVHLKIEQVNFTLILLATGLYGLCHFSEISSDSLF